MWVLPQIFEIIIPRQGQQSQGATDIELAPTLHLRDQRMFRILRAENSLRDLCRTPFINLLNLQNSEQLVFDIAQGDFPVQMQGRVCIQWQRDWDWKHMPDASAQEWTDDLLS